MEAILILFLSAIALLFAGLSKNRDRLLWIALIGAALALGSTLWHIFDSAAGFDWNAHYSSMLHFDRFALTFSAVALGAMLLILGLSRWGFRQLSETLGDQYALLFFSLCGALCMFAFDNIVLLFLGIEILSIPLYVLAGSKRDSLASNEAALKYFLMGAFATGILLFGIALMYGATRSFNLHDIASCISDNRHSAGMLHTGILLILVGLSFKISAAPFHFWAPDVYQGSPNLVTTYMATVVKTAAFAAFYRLFSWSFVGAADFWALPVSVLAGLTMTIANFTAIFQTDFKRMMAYSSISHAGYLLLGILAIGQSSVAGAILLYTLAYSIATICAFAVFMVVSEENLDSRFDAFKGLASKQPFLAASMAIAVLSLAGIPPLAGFFGKYYLFTAALDKYPWLVLIAVLNSAVSVYYYLKVIIAMYFSRESSEYTIATPRSFKYVLIIGLALMAALIIAPGLVYGAI